MRSYSLRGGNAKLQAVPVESYGFEYGGNESENSAKMLSDMSNKQNELNNVLTGGRRKRIKGGSNDTQETIEIPQFPPVGPQVSNQTSNTAAYQVNSVLIRATNDASNDSLIGEPQSGGKRKKTKKQNKKYSKSKKNKTKKNRMYLKDAHINGHKKGCHCRLCRNLRMRMMLKSKKNKKH
jgi:hypothetical protein